MGGGGDDSLKIVTSGRLEYVLIIGIPLPCIKGEKPTTGNMTSIVENAQFTLTHTLFHIIEAN